MSQYSLKNHNKLSPWNYSNTVCVIKENDRSVQLRLFGALFPLMDMTAHTTVFGGLRGEGEEEFIFLALHTVDLRPQFPGF